MPYIFSLYKYLKHNTFFLTEKFGFADPVFAW